MTKVKTRQQIADEFGIDRKTLYRWLKRRKIDIEVGLLTPSDQAKIYNTWSKADKSTGSANAADSKEQ